MLRDTCPTLCTGVSIEVHGKHDPQQLLSLFPEKPRLSGAPLSPADDLESHPQIMATGGAIPNTRRHAARDENHLTATPDNTRQTISLDSTTDEGQMLSQNHRESPPLSLPPSDDDLLDDAEKERRHQALALEQQQRILRQVEAARQVKRIKEQRKHHQQEPAHLRVLTHVAPSKAPTGHADAPMATFPPATKNKQGEHNNIDNQQHHHHFHDDTAARAARRAYQQVRHPRTKGLLYQRLADGSLVPIDRPIGRH